MVVPSDAREIKLRMYINGQADAIPELTTATFDSVSLAYLDAEYERGEKEQFLTVQASNKLLGLPVSTGGNYTDESGQEWICDEVDFARGLKIQRIGRIESYNGESVGDVFMSSTGELSTGATVIYPLAKPIETPLTADELAQYAALHTNKPNTTILNNGGAGMMANYTADTKIYIDKKFEALTAAIAAVENNEI